MTSSTSFLSKLLSRLFLFLGCFVLSTSVSVHASTQTIPPKIIAMGDMHGDYNAYESLMHEANLMDADGNWSGGKTIFVQTGDIPDRGPDTRKIIESLQRLEKQAPQSGGKVIPLVGNHEAMNMIGDLRYVHPGEYAAFADDNSAATRDTYYTSNQSAIERKYRKKKPEATSATVKEKWHKNTPLGKKEHRDVWNPNGYIGKWVAGNQVVVKVQNYLFAHGGFSNEYTQYTLDEMNAAGRKTLLAQNTDRSSILRDNVGPLWYRGNVRGRKTLPSEAPFSKDEEVTGVLKTYDATHIIIGHTRNEEGIRVSSNGRVFQIDTGASAAYGGVPSFLRIENGDFFAHTIGGSTKLEACP